MITYNGLIQLGFDPSEFKLSNSVASNRQTYISYWGSNKPEPSIEEIEQAEQVYIAEAQAQAEAKAQLRTSVINKIATNLTSEEKLWLEENL
jgi:hypothetical protein